MTKLKVRKKERGTRLQLQKHWKHDPTGHENIGTVIYQPMPTNPKATKHAKNYKESENAKH